MCPLPQGSKKHYCVHKVAKGPNLEEECDKMLADGDCRFFNGTKHLFGLQSSTLKARC